jgi:D-xylose transport system permease protein
MAELTKTASDPSDARASSFSLDSETRDIPAAIRGYWNRLRAGDPGALPSVLGLLALVLIFDQVSDRFLTRYNIGNLPGQGAYIAIIALGLIFVLLLGEIDLSAGTTGGLCAAFAARGIIGGGLRDALPGLMYGMLLGLMGLAVVLGVLVKIYVGPALILVGLLFTLTGLDKHVIPALILAVSIGTAVGIINGFLVAKVGIPSFIVTLALFLAWQGAIILVLASEARPVRNFELWNGFSNNNMSPAWSWVFVIGAAGGYLVFTAARSLRSRAKGASYEAMSLVFIRGALIMALGVVIVIFANQNRNPNEGFPIKGLPWAATIPVALMIVCAIALTKTTWGRHLFATGGNEEAARRAGIDVVRIKVTAFMLCSSFAAFGGIMLSSYLGTVTLDLGAGNILLFSVAAAVIGGTSLFGGRGRARDAIIGGLVIAIIPNGIGLRPSLPAEYNNVITGLVLLVAASVDAISRRRARTR